MRQNFILVTCKWSFTFDFGCSALRFYFSHQSLVLKTTFSYSVKIYLLVPFALLHIFISCDSLNFTLLCTSVMYWHIGSNNNSWYLQKPKTNHRQAELRCTSPLYEVSSLKNMCQSNEAEIEHCISSLWSGRAVTLCCSSWPMIHTVSVHSTWMTE